MNSGMKRHNQNGRQHTCLNCRDDAYGFGMRGGGSAGKRKFNRLRAIGFFLLQASVTQCKVTGMDCQASRPCLHARLAWVYIIWAEAYHRVCLLVFATCRRCCCVAYSISSVVETRERALSSF